VQTIAVIDFETTGLSPPQGARATEIAAVLLRDGRIVDRYQSLMFTGVWVPPFIEQLTGISNRMLERAPPAAEVMCAVGEFTRGCAMVAHNASFDRGFWRSERALAGLGDERAAEAVAPNPDAFGCTMRLSRRLYPEAPNHRLGTLAEWLGLEPSGRAHRALGDAEVAAQLWLRIVRDAERRWALPASASFEQLVALQDWSRQRIERVLAIPARRAAAPLKRSPAA
jgi:DNA polymerase-3 subunit epsilon